MPRRDDGSICYSDTHYRDTWIAMEKLVDKGLIKAIGLSNFNARQIDDIISIARHKPVMNQVQTNAKVHLVNNKPMRRKIKLIFVCYCATGGMPPIFFSG